MRVCTICISHFEQSLQSERVKLSLRFDIGCRKFFRECEELNRIIFSCLH